MSAGGVSGGGVGVSGGGGKSFSFHSCSTLCIGIVSGFLCLIFSEFFLIYFFNDPMIRGPTALARTPLWRSMKFCTFDFFWFLVNSF
jgi:hypothetical protein